MARLIAMKIIKRIAEAIKKNACEISKMSVKKTSRNNFQRVC